MTQVSRPEHEINLCACIFYGVKASCLLFHLISAMGRLHFLHLLLFKVSSTDSEKSPIPKYPQSRTRVAPGSDVTEPLTWRWTCNWYREVGTCCGCTGNYRELLLLWQLLPLGLKWYQCKLVRRMVHEHIWSDIISPYILARAGKNGQKS